MRKTYISPGISVIEAEAVMPLAASPDTPKAADWETQAENTGDKVPSFAGSISSKEAFDDLDLHSKEDGGSLWD